MKFYKRSRILWSVFLLGLIVQVVQLTIAGCSHTSPYYHPDIVVAEKQDIVKEENLHYRILLLGDGGQPKTDEPVLKTLQVWAEKMPKKTSVIFLGDNMYPDGMTEQKQHEASTRLGPQLEVVKSSGTHGLFIPGNHDWSNGKEVGIARFLHKRNILMQPYPAIQNSCREAVLRDRLRWNFQSRHLLFGSLCLIRSGGCINTKSRKKPRRQL